MCKKYDMYVIRWKIPYFTEGMPSAVADNIFMCHPRGCIFLK